MITYLNSQIKRVGMFLGAAIIVLSSAPTWASPYQCGLKTFAAKVNLVMSFDMNKRLVGYHLRFYDLRGAAHNLSFQDSGIVHFERNYETPYGGQPVRSDFAFVTKNANVGLNLARPEQDYTDVATVYIQNIGKFQLKCPNP